jgi:hypothetical protein
MFIPESESGFFSIPDPDSGFNKAEKPDPDPQHW